MATIAVEAGYFGDSCHGHRLSWCQSMSSQLVKTRDRSANFCQSFVFASRWPSCHHPASHAEPTVGFIRHLWRLSGTIMPYCGSWFCERDQRWRIERMMELWAAKKSLRGNLRKGKADSESVWPRRILRKPPCMSPSELQLLIFPGDTSECHDLDSVKEHLMIHRDRENMLKCFKSSVFSFLWKLLWYNQRQMRF